MAQMEEAEILEDGDLDHGDVAASASSISSDPTAKEQDSKHRAEITAEINDFLKKYTPESSVLGKKGALHDRYIFRTNEEIPELSNELATACNVVDENNRERKIYGMVCRKDLPYRLKNMQALKGLDHTNVIQLVDYGAFECAEESRVKMGAVLEKPHGDTIRVVLESKHAQFTEGFIVDHVITPICDALLVFRNKGVSHGSINLDTVYMSEKVQLGECVSQPCGYAQNYMFEAPERCLVAPFGKGEAPIHVDCYALGVLVMHMLMGVKHYERMEEASFQRMRDTLGSYNALVGTKDVKSLVDFLKGVLNDDPHDRWSPEMVDLWIKGKKFNLLTPSILREAQRPFDFLGEDYFSRRALAHTIAKHWEEAKPILRTIHLSRWFEVSLHRNELAEAVRKLVDRTGGANSMSDRSNNELVARTIVLLDPEGPVHFLSVAANIDGLGPMLADAYRRRDQKMIQECLEILEYNYFGFAQEWIEDEKYRRSVGILMKMQNCARYLRVQSMGFGIERVLYELNPNLACQSQLLAEENVLTLDELLEALDRLGVRQARGFDYLDRHIAAFVASRLDISKEVKIKDLQSMPSLMQNPQLVILDMLSQAQRKIGKPKFKGLSHWSVLRILPLLDNFHSRTIRKNLRQNLKVAARTGDLDKLFHFLLDQNIVSEDANGFLKAVSQFSRNSKEIARLENPDKRQARATRIGTMFAMILAYAGLLVVMAFSLKGFHF